MHNVVLWCFECSTCRLKSSALLERAGINVVRKALVPYFNHVNQKTALIHLHPNLNSPCFFPISEILFIDTALSAKSTYHFDRTTYRLDGISNEFDDSSLSFGYKDEDPPNVDSITSTLGSRLDLEYNSHGLVDTVTLSGDEIQTRVSR